MQKVVPSNQLASPFGREAMSSKELAQPQSPTRAPTSRMSLRGIIPGTANLSNRSIESTGSSKVSDTSGAPNRRMLRRRSNSPKKTKNFSFPSSGGDNGMTDKHEQEKEESVLASLTPQSLYQQLPSSNGFQEEDETTGLPSPQAFLDRILQRRGYNTRKYSTLKTSYHCDPTPLQRASYHTFFFSLLLQQEQGGSNLETIRAILSTGVSPNACNARGETFLHSLARLGHGNHMPLWELLTVEFQASVQVSDDEGRTPLHEACFRRRSSQRRPQRRRSSGSSNNSQPLPPCFELVDMIARTDVNLFFLKDAHGLTPLMYVDQQHWLSWLEYLDAKRDEFWPRQHSSSSKNSITSGIKKQVPPLAARPPNARSLPTTAASATLNPQLAARIVSGRVKPEQVEELRNRKRYNMDYYSSNRSISSETSGAAASGSDRSTGRSSDDSYIGTWLKKPSSSQNSGNDDDHYADNIMLGGLQVPTLRYALTNKDYTYNPVAADTSSIYGSEDNHSEDGSRQTEGEETSEHRRRSHELEKLEQKLSFPDQQHYHLKSDMLVPDSGSSVSSGEATSESMDARRRSTKHLQGKQPRRLSSKLNLPGFGDDWGHSSFSSRFSEADTIESQMGRDSGHLGLNSGHKRDEEEGELADGLYNDTASFHGSSRSVGLNNLASVHSQDTSIVSTSAHSRSKRNLQEFAKPRDASAHSQGGGGSSLSKHLNHSSAVSRRQNSSVRSRTSIISLERTKYYDPSTSSTSGQAGESKTQASEESSTCQNLTPLQRKLQQQHSGPKGKEDNLSALDIPGLELRDEEVEEADGDLDIDSLVSGSFHKKQDDSCISGSFHKRTQEEQVQPRPSTSKAEMKDRPKQSQSSMHERQPDGSLEGSTESFMMFM